MERNSKETNQRDRDHLDYNLRQHCPAKKGAAQPDFAKASALRARLLKELALKVS